MSVAYSKFGLGGINTGKTECRVANSGISGQKVSSVMTGSISVCVDRLETALSKLIEGLENHKSAYDQRLEEIEVQLNQERALSQSIKQELEHASQTARQNAIQEFQEKVDELLQRESILIQEIQKLKQQTVDQDKQRTKDMEDLTKIISEVSRILT